jgi:hypothetical protein
VTKKAPRLPLRSLPNPKVQVQYLVIPYADFRVGSLGGLDHFTFGPFELWRDTTDNWPKYLACPRPSKHLAMYVGRDGTPLGSMWIASVPNSQKLAADHWQWITAALFYLAWARIPYVSFDRAAAEDFYSEAFVVPEGADPDSLTHVRWSKFGTTVWSDVKIYPALEVSTRGTVIELPLASPPTNSLFFDPTPGELYRALEKEISRPASRLLTGLWFLHQACYRSAYRELHSRAQECRCIRRRPSRGRARIVRSGRLLARPLLGEFGQAPGSPGGTGGRTGVQAGIYHRCSVQALNCGVWVREKQGWLGRAVFHARGREHPVAPLWQGHHRSHGIPDAPLGRGIVEVGVRKAFHMTLLACSSAWPIGLTSV